jgi:hypothetical protein
MSFHLSDANGKFNLRESPAGELSILAEERNGAMEIVLPANLFIGSKLVSFGWIDAYR